MFGQNLLGIRVRSITAPALLSHTPQRAGFRWCDMSKSIAHKERWFNEMFGFSKQGIRNCKKIPDSVLELIPNRNNLTILNQIVEIFDTIATCTKSLEGNNSSICDVWQEVQQAGHIKYDCELCH